MFNVILDGAAIGVLVTATGTIVTGVTRTIQARGQYRAKAADEYVNATKKLSTYATALQAIADLLETEEEGGLPSRELCGKVQRLAKHALGTNSRRIEDHIYREHRRIRGYPDDTT